jgi:hypothetical protein
MPGYDLIASNPDRKTSARIRVKSIFVSKAYPAQLLKNPDADFVVLVMLNRAPKDKPKPTTVTPPDIYVFPMEVILPHKKIDDVWNKVMIGKVTNRKDYRDAWHLIQNFLSDPVGP